MAEEATAPAPAAPATDQAGIARTTDGQIAPGTATTPPPKPPAEVAEEPTLLTKDAAKAEPAGAPEKYEDYKVPEGFVLDPEIKESADKIFKGMGLSQAQAQELVNFYTEKTKEAFEAPFEAYQETRKEWRTAAEADPELRGKLQPGGEVITTVSKALDSLGDPKLASDFRQAMDFTGAGDNPAFIKAFFRMAQRLTEGTHVSGRGPSEAGQSKSGVPTRTPAQDLWPNLPSTAR